MSESKVKEAMKAEAGLTDQADTISRDDHKDIVLAQMHELMKVSELNANEAIELYFRAMLGVAYDASGNMTTAIEKLEEYLLTTLTKLVREAKPRITEIVERPTKIITTRH